MDLGWLAQHKLKTGLGVLAVVVLIAVVGASSHHISPVSWGWYQPYDTDSGVALSGYDAVAYHTEGAAIAGQATITGQWMDATWQFSSETNRDLFLANPERYAPQYGGHCAQAVSAGVTALVDPTVWHIEDGRLFLFFDTDVRAGWLEGMHNGLLAAADENWSDR